MILEDEYISQATVPSGAYTGAHEAVKLRDGDKGRYAGKGVLTAVDNVNDKMTEIVDGRYRAARHQHPHDQYGRHRRQNNLGANAILGVLAPWRARAAASALTLPLSRYSAA